MKPMTRRILKRAEMLREVRGAMVVMLSELSGQPRRITKDEAVALILSHPDTICCESCGNTASLHV